MKRWIITDADFTFVSVKWLCEWFNFDDCLLHARFVYTRMRVCARVWWIWNTRRMCTNYPAWIAIVWKSTKMYEGGITENFTGRRGVVNVHIICTRITYTPVSPFLSYYKRAHTHLHPNGGDAVCMYRKRIPKLLLLLLLNIPAYIQTYRKYAKHFVHVFLLICLYRAAHTSIYCACISRISFELTELFILVAMLEFGISHRISLIFHYFNSPLYVNKIDGMKIEQAVCHSVFFTAMPKLTTVI